MSKDIKDNSSLGNLYILDQPNKYQTHLIFDFLETDDISQLSQLSDVCQAINQLLTKRYCKIASKDIKSEDEILAFLAKNGQRLLKLDLSRNEYVTDKTLLEIPSLCPNLQVLYLERCDQISPIGLEKLTQLKSLRILNLRSCDINDEGVCFLTQSNIHTLNLGYCTKISSEGFSQLSQLSLRSLNLIGCIQVTNDDVSTLSAITKLESLNLSFCSEITGAALSAISKLTNLEVLIARNCKKIDNTGLNDLIALVNLRIVNFSGCKKINEAGVSYISKLPLINISFYGCTEIRNEDLQCLSGLPLIKLDLTNCKSLSPEFRKLFNSRGELLKAGIVADNVDFQALEQVDKKEIPATVIKDGSANCLESSEIRR